VSTRTWGLLWGKNQSVSWGFEGEKEEFSEGGGGWLGPFSSGLLLGGEEERGEVSLKVRE